MSRTLARLCLCMLLVAAGAPWSIRAETVPTLDQPQPSISPSGNVEPGIRRLAPGELVTPGIPSAGPSQPPSGPRPGAPPSALDAELARLRATAQASPANGRGNAAQARAAWVLGLLYLHGIGVPASAAEADNWFARAFSLGETQAAAGLAWCQIDGCSGPPNPAGARRWLLALRAVNPQRALYLQWLMEARMAPLSLASPGSPGSAQPGALASRQMLARAAAAGDLQARMELGLALAEANRAAEAIEQFRAAAALSPAAASNAALLSEQLQQTRSGLQREAATPASQTLGRAQRNHRGEGQSANYVEAIRLYRLAQSQGSAEARKMLELIFSRPGPDGEVDVQWMQQLAYLNVSSNSVTLESPAGRHVLRREPTALSDLLPPPWRQRLSQNQVSR